MTVFAAPIIRLDSAAGPVSVLVAEASGGDQLVHSILREFVFDIAWYVPPFVAVALLLAAYSVRRSLLPLRAASARASAIGPQSIALRLPETNVPTEALPLVTAVNQALDRLEQGFVIKRRFTGNAAHELRTPLTIVTARLEASSTQSAAPSRCSRRWPSGTLVSRRTTASNRASASISAT